MEEIEIHSSLSVLESRVDRQSDFIEKQRCVNEDVTLAITKNTYAVAELTKQTEKLYTAYQQGNGALKVFTYVGAALAGLVGILIGLKEYFNF